jgi:hypothetical protein
MIETREYTCERCGRTFITDQSLEEVHAETREVFGFIPDETDGAWLCDECNGPFRAWLDSLSPEERAELSREGPDQVPGDTSYEP